MKKKLISSFCIIYLIQTVSSLSYGLLSADSVHDSVTVKKCSDFKITGDGLSDQWNNTSWINLKVEGASESLVEDKNQSSIF